VRVLVTGGAGFIGHHLVHALAARGDEVVVVDDFSTGFRSRVTGFSDVVKVVEGDIRDPGALDAASAGCEVIFHQAALASVVRSIRNPILTNAVKTSGTIEVMLAAAKAKVRRVVYAGSSSVYGTLPDLPRRETQPIDPRSPYATSKLAGEYYAKSLGALHGVETVVLRYFNIFGPSQDPDSEYAAVVPRFVKAGLLGESPVVYGDGTQTRDFTYVDNVVSANLLAATASGVDGITANVACGGRYSIHELLSVIGDCLGHPLAPVYAPSRLGDVPHSEADIAVARQMLGYEVLVPFHEGIRRTVEWYRATHGISSGQSS
jgi:nucleoside-diphosphate-sugar epimerase